jgi:kinetochore protein Mis13/DSN1
MSPAQRPTRRLSTRIQEKEDAPPHPSQVQTNGHVKPIAASSYPAVAQNAKANARKRKMSRFAQRAGTWEPNTIAYIWNPDYDEEDDGFMFKRVKKKEPEPKPAKEETVTAPVEDDVPKSQHAPPDKAGVVKNDDTASKPKARRKRMSFSTPKPQDDPPPRRSKRLSKDNGHADASPAKKPARKEASPKQPEQQAEHRPQESPNRGTRREPPKKHSEQRSEIQAGQSPRKRRKEQKEGKPNDQHPGSVQDGHQAETVPTLQENGSATRIALPLADTPVIKRNKAMRESKAGKGERRSSLGNRGRRASSLIESGTSNGKRGNAQKKAGLG